MKRNLLISAALMAAGSAMAASPNFQTADAASFIAGPKVETKSAKAQAMTRAEGDMESFYFTYSDELYSAFTLGNELTGGVSRVYLAFQMAQEDIKTYAGSQVTGIAVYSPTDYTRTSNSITQAQFFYSTDPQLKQLDYTQDFTMSRTAFGLNKVGIKDAYTITGEETALYFGYSFVIPKKNDMYYIPVDAVPNRATTGIYGVSLDGETYPTQFTTFGNSQYGALTMAVMLEREHLPKFVDFTTFPSTLCLPKDKSTMFPLVLQATSGSTIESVNLEYTFGGKTEDKTINLANPVPAGRGSYFVTYLDFPAISENLNEDVEFKLTKINGIANTGDKATAEARVAVVDELPNHQTLYEEYTGTWCPWCPRGFAALEYMRANYPEFVTASFHQGDAMQVTENFPSPVASFPSAVLNREDIVDPYDGSTAFADMLVPVVGDIQWLNEIPTSWEISVEHEWETDDVLVAKTSFSNFAGYKNKDFKIAYLLVADGLTGTDWYQKNNYATQKPKYCDELNAFCKGGEYGKAIVVGLIFNDVVVSDNGIYGIAGSVPKSMEPYQKAEHSRKFDLSKIGSTLIPDRNKLRVIAMVLDKEGIVLNSTKTEVNDYDAFVAGVEGISSENGPVEYYNLNGMKISQPTEGVFIRRQGGKAEKVMIK